MIISSSYIAQRFHISYLSLIQTSHDTLLTLEKTCLMNILDAFLAKKHTSFSKPIPSFSGVLHYTALATRELLSFHDPQATDLPTFTEIDWKGLTDPFPFHLVFEEDRTPEALINRIQQLTPGEPNLWIYQLPYIIRSCRQISLLIQQLETFFQALRF